MRNNWSQAQAMIHYPITIQKLREITGAYDVAFLPFKSSNTHKATYMAITRDGRVFSIRRRGYKIMDGKPVGGTWFAIERSLGNNPNPNIPIRHMGQDTGMYLARLLALTFVGEPPFDGAEAAYEGARPTADNVRWVAPRERAAKLSNRKRDTSHIYISDEVNGVIQSRFAQQVRQHGMTYVIDSILRRYLGMEELPTPHERRSRRKPKTKTAQILLLARRHPEKSHIEIAEIVGSSPAFVRNVLVKNHVSLKELRLRKRLNDTVRRIAEQQRDTNIITDAKSGLFSRRELAERYKVSQNTVQRILNDAGISLAEVKRKKREQD